MTRRPYGTGTIARRFVVRYSPATFEVVLDADDDATRAWLRALPIEEFAKITEAVDAMRERWLCRPIHVQNHTELHAIAADFAERLRGAFPAEVVYALSETTP
jgi:hypothetical protein